MKVFLLALTTLLASALADDPHYRKQVDSAFVERQKKLLDVLSGVSANNLDSTYVHEHKDFTFNKPELYTEPEVWEKFFHRYEQGFVSRDSIFTLNHYQSRHDTFALFELMYFAKDFDTFIDIAQWAKYELNAMQFSYAFTIAALHRSDCRGMYLPPIYEIFPHFYVPSDVMRQADLAALYDVEYRLFDVNNTGHEYSFYSDMTSGVSKNHPRWVGDDVESRISYFREDPGLSHWYTTAMARWATWLSSEKYPGIEFIKRGKKLYTTHKWMLSRYNLERLSLDMPFVAPFDWDKPAIGYNPKLTDYMGRPFISRPDHVVPSYANPSGFSYLDKIEGRIQDAIDTEKIWEFKNNTFINWDEKTGLDYLGKIIFGERGGIGRYYYKPWFFLMMEAINDMIHSSNDRDYTNSAFGKYMTVVRDPLFYQVLASMDEWFETYTSSLNPYTPEDLKFPGVTVQKIEFSKLMTYFERWEYEITQGVAFKKPEDRQNKKYMVSHPRINHKPFNFNITIESPRAQDAMIRVFFGPKTNIDNREMSLNQARHAFFMGAFFPIKLKAGVNVISKNSEDFYFFEHFEPFRAFKDRITKSENAEKPFHVNTLSNCGLPSNLMLPRGWGDGRQYKVFVMAEPVTGEKSFKDQNYYQCNTQQYMDQPPITFPFDRPIPFPKTFVQPNMIFQDVTVYHKFESDLNRPHST